MKSNPRCLVTTWGIIGFFLLSGLLQNSLPVTLGATQANRLGRITPELRALCLAKLREGLNSSEFWPAMHAAEALTLAGLEREVIASLQPRLLRETDDQRRCGLARELVRAGNRDSLRILFEILGNENSTGRVHAAESLYKVGEIGDGTLLRRAYAQPENTHLRLMAAAALAEAGDAESLIWLRGELRSEDRLSRQLSVWVLARLGNESDKAPLLRMREHEQDAVVRGMIANALACLGEPRGFQDLVGNLQSENPTVRVMAAEFAGYSRKAVAQEHLCPLLNDPVLDVRLRAAQSLLVLSKIGEQDEKP
ncbi:MAG: HEAT repeat domain-containing protein [Planctomycetaceae bacterium]